MNILNAPWSDETVKNLEQWQNEGHFHPYTCTCEGKGNDILIPTPDGWFCKRCDKIVQTWCLE